VHSRLAALVFLPALACAEIRSAWDECSPLPVPLGVAGTFAGPSGGALLVAGGANFPNGMPWEGGKKVWQQEVWVLNEPHGTWKLAGKLPRPLAYGVSVTHADGVVCVGGSDAEKHYADAFRLTWKDGALATQPLPPLPVTLANAAGALVSETLIVAGGTTQPGEQAASNAVYAINLAVPKPAWRELPPLPGRPRFLAVAGSHAGAFYLFGGVALAPQKDGKIAREYLRESWRYRESDGWQRLADLPKPCAAAPSPAPFSKGRFLLLGGDDGSLVGFQPPEKHPGFPSTYFVYMVADDQWLPGLGTPPARATLPCVEWRGRFVMPSGEVRPGVRSPEVWSIDLK
jgi:N-acetylneuraminic acid mutarotase